jgi:type 1 fimbriae regulatory protein FimB/type 1 fimbriae regulatory protein FimE
MKAAGSNRHGHRDATMVLLTYRHGLRASELSALRWEQVDLVHGLLHVARVKNGMPSVHPLTGKSYGFYTGCSASRSWGATCS